MAPVNLLAQRVFGSYARTFNNRHGRSGTLFEDRFDAKLVDTDEYLHHLCYYIHANPVRHNIATAPDLWLYSNYHEYVGARNGDLVDHIFIQTHFGNGQRYRQRVIDSLTGNITLPAPLRAYLEALEQG